ncbi:unnamed protein product [Cuscuta epithymum]|uniref:SIT4 phosphatase-associated family protein n=1 Tax=Cuscuta epithymum TaxID=186058 RepID=A0AAV0FH15_9ASTE|nr:unnamed protein product [Cuscuta epithymum]
MFWRMAGLSTASPVEAILDKETFTLEELLDEDEIIQECKALNGRLINYLRERPQVEQLVRYIVEDAAEDAEKKRTFKFPFIACEIFTCEVDIILKALVDDEELMNLLFSFLEPGRPHSTLLAGYFSKVVICLLQRKTVPLMNYIQCHQEVIRKLVDLIGITSIMEVLIRLISSDEHMYSNFVDSMQWLGDTDVLEMIVDKFSSSDCPEVHANAAEMLCAITRYAPPGLSAKISSPSFIGRLFRHALEGSRPKSVLVNSLSICISLLDPKRLTSGTYYFFNRQSTQGTGLAANPKTVEGMLESLGDLMKLLDVSLEDNVLPTTYGKLQPPLGKHRLKIVEFISVLVSVSSEAAEKELIGLGAVKKILDLFFQYPYNNFLHHNVEQIIVTCLESRNPQFVEHVLHDCNLVGKILEAEKTLTLTADSTKPTVPVEGKSPPRIGNMGHITRLANKLIQLGNHNDNIQSYLQENSEWVDWRTDVLQKRNAVENVMQWACGRPTALQDRMRDSDDDDYQDRDYDVAALANNLSQAFRYGIYNNDDMDEAHGALERDDEDVYFDDESAEVVISSLRLGEEQDSGSLFTNSNWFAFEDENRMGSDLPGPVASPSPNSTNVTDIIISPTSIKKDEPTVNEDGDNEDGDNELADTAASAPSSEPKEPTAEPNMIEDSQNPAPTKAGREEWTDWRENSETTTYIPSDTPDPTPVAGPLTLPNGAFEAGVVDTAESSAAAAVTTSSTLSSTNSETLSVVLSSAEPEEVDSRYGNSGHTAPV